MTLADSLELMQPNAHGRILVALDLSQRREIVKALRIAAMPVVPDNYPRYYRHQSININTFSERSAIRDGTLEACANLATPVSGIRY